MKAFGFIAVMAISLQLSECLLFSSGWGSPPGWGWEGPAASAGGGWGESHDDHGDGGWGWEQPKVIETHRHVHKVHNYDTHEKKIKNFDHHEHKVHEHHKTKKVILRDHLHKHNLAVHTHHQKILKQHNVHQHNIHKQNLHIVKVHEPIHHIYHKTQHKVIPSIQEVTKVIPIHETKHQVHEHVKHAAPQILEHKGWGSEQPSGGWGGWGEEAAPAGDGWSR